MYFQEEIFYIICSKASSYMKNADPLLKISEDFARDVWYIKIINNLKATEPPIKK